MSNVSIGADGRGSSGADEEPPEPPNIMSAARCVEQWSVVVSEETIYVPLHLNIPVYAAEDANRNFAVAILSQLKHLRQCRLLSCC